MAASLFAACDQSAVVEQPQAAAEVTIRVVEPALTRAGKESFVEGDAIGIFAVERTDANKVAVPTEAAGRANNAKWVRDASGKWAPASAADRITWSQKGAKVDFYAYYPYDEKASNPTAIALNLSEQSDACDVLRAANVEGLSEGSVTLAFNHVLAMVQVCVAGLAESDDVRISGVKSAATLNLGSGDVAATGDAAAVKLSFKELQDKVEVPHALFQAILPAQTVEEGTVQCDHVAASYLYPFTNLTLETGKIKTFELTIK